MGFYGSELKGMGELMPARTYGAITPGRNVMVRRYPEQYRYQNKYGDEKTEDGFIAWTHSPTGKALAIAGSIGIIYLIIKGITGFEGPVDKMMRYKRYLEYERKRKKSKQRR